MSSKMIGCILTRSQGSLPPPGADVCIDNECFNDSKFSDELYREYLESIDPEIIGRAKFAVAPDVVGSHSDTLIRSAPWFEIIRSLNLPVAFVGQDGADVSTIPWNEFDAFFIGGSTDWKLSDSAKRLTSYANHVGKWTHMGRVNSRRRILMAARWGCDSVDGTFLTFGPDVNLPKLIRWIDEANNPLKYSRQDDLFEMNNDWIQQ